MWPSFDDVVPLLPGAFAIAVMFLETVAVGLGLRRSAEPDIDNDQELVANGVSCVGGAFFRAMPSAGGFSQSAINESSGARTQLSELVTVALPITCALFLGDVLSDLPEATLGCMVVVAVIGLIKPAEIVRLFRLSRVEFWVAAITARALHRQRALREPQDRRRRGRPGDTARRARARRVGGEHPHSDGDRRPTRARTGTHLVRGDVLARRAAGGSARPARQLPRWREFDETGRIHPTGLAAVRAYRGSLRSG